MKKLELSFLDRLLIPTVLPREASYIEQRVCKDVIDKVSISQDEIVTYKVKNTGESLTWDNSAPKKEIEFSDAEVSLIAKELRNLDSKKKVSVNMIGLFEKFGIEEEK